MLSVGVAVVLGLFGAKMDEAKGPLASLNAKGLAQACEAYCLNPASGNAYPAMLADLVDPPLYVWAERVVNGRTKVYGQNPPEKKQ